MYWGGEEGFSVLLGSRVFIFDKVKFIIFFPFRDHALVIYLRILCLTHSCEDFLLCILFFYFFINIFIYLFIGGGVSSLLRVDFL